jgi:hypothetical protein
MPKYMDVHSGFVGVTAEQLEEAHQRDLALEGEEGVHFEHAWLDPESGKAFCLSTGRTRRASCGSTSGPATRRARSMRCPSK